MRPRSAQLAGVSPDQRSIRSRMRLSPGHQAACARARSRRRPHGITPHAPHPGPGHEPARALPGMVTRSASDPPCSPCSPGHETVQHRQHRGPSHAVPHGDPRVAGIVVRTCWRSTGSRPRRRRGRLGDSAGNGCFVSSPSPRHRRASVPAGDSRGAGTGQNPPELLARRFVMLALPLAPTTVPISLPTEGSPRVTGPLRIHPSLKAHHATSGSVHMRRDSSRASNSLARIGAAPRSRGAAVRVHRRASRCCSADGRPTLQYAGRGAADRGVALPRALRPPSR